MFKDSFSEWFSDRSDSRVLGLKRARGFTGIFQKVVEFSAPFVLEVQHQFPLEISIGK
jgi:hypothetical protein